MRPLLCTGADDNAMLQCQANKKESGEPGIPKIEHMDRMDRTKHSLNYGGFDRVWDIFLGDIVSGIYVQGG